MVRWKAGWVRFRWNIFNLPDAAPALTSQAPNGPDPRGGTISWGATRTRERRTLNPPDFRISKTEATQGQWRSELGLVTASQVYRLDEARR